MPSLNSLEGRQFNFWEVISRADNKNSNTYWYCMCDCGTLKTVASQSLISGVSKSCGCLHSYELTKRNTTHGDGHKTRLNRIWQSMRNRCSNRNNTHYKNYGGRGIKVCSTWNSYIAFRDWALNNGYHDTLSIDRVDNNEGYNPTNCRWATSKQQANNRRKRSTVQNRNPLGQFTGVA